MKSAWLEERRETAQAKLKKLDPPTSKDEVWRYSDIDELDLGAYSPLGERGAYDLGAASAADYLDGVQAEFGELSCLLLSQSSYFLDGWFSKEFSGSLYAGPLNEAGSGGENGKSLDWLESGDGIQKPADYFSMMNEVNMVEPLYIHIPAGMQLEKPIGILELAEIDGVKFFPRLVVRVEKGAAAKVIHIFRSDTAGNFSAPAVDLSLESASSLDYLCVEDLSQSARQIGMQSAAVGSDASLSLNTVSLGGQSVRLRTDCRLEGRGASGKILSLYFANQNQNFDFRTFQKHSARDTTSSLLFKGAVDDSARLVYSGMIRVGNDAKSTNAFQANHNLKLSEDAWVESVPNLEIETNDVVCSHASTVGPVDEDQKFYLESRGIPGDVSERLIVAGFFKEALARLPFPDAAPALFERLISRFLPAPHSSSVLPDKTQGRDKK